MREIKNARIGRTFLGMEDHGIFTFTLHLDYDGSGQGFGQHTLDEPIKKDGKFLGRVGTAVGMDSIMKVLETLGVESWEKLPGTYLRADSDFGCVYRIGHITKDNWFDLKEHFKKWGIE